MLVLSIAASREPATRRSATCLQSPPSIRWLRPFSRRGLPVDHWRHDDAGWPHDFLTPMARILQRVNLRAIGRTATESYPARLTS